MNRFQRLILYAGVLPALLAFISCDEDDNDATLEVSTTACSFKATGGRKTVVVATDGSDWQAALTGNDRDCFQIVPERDQIAILAFPNESEEMKTAEVRIETGNTYALIRLTQAPGGVPQITIDPVMEERTFSSFGGTQVFRVESNYEWQAAADKDWLSVSAEEDLVKITVPDYAGDERLSAVLTFSTVGPDEPAVESITVSQLTRRENPYYALLGKWEIHCNSWWYDGNILPGPTYPKASFMLEELVPGERYMMKDFFQTGTAIDIYYEETEDGVTLMIPTGWIVLDDREGFGYVHYFVPCNVNTRQLSAAYGFIYGKVEDFENITVTGIPAAMGLGIVSIKVDTMELTWWSDLHYAIVPEITFVKSADQPEPSSYGLSPMPENDIPRYVNPTGMPEYFTNI